MTLRKYDPSQVAIIFGPVGPIGGFADGTFVSVEQNEDSFALSVGSDGEGTRAKSNNRSGRVTVTLAQSSASNALLSAAHLLDINSANGDGIGPLLVADRSGTSLYEAENAWIVRPPAAEFGRDGAATREWIIETDNLNQVHGGN